MIWYSELTSSLLWLFNANSPTYVHSYNAELLQVMHSIYMAELFLLHLVVWERGTNSIM